MDVLRRIEKFRRLARWRLRSASCVPLWWHVGRPNFGDDINPSFFEAIGVPAVRFAVSRSRPHLLGAGSILESATRHSVVCGAGFLEPPRRPVAAPAAVVAVRGELSRAAFDGAETVLLGDPLVLVDGLVSPVARRHAVGLVPHVFSTKRWRARIRPGIHLVDPSADPWAVVRDIAACDLVVSQSLHGLIVADALGVPNVWVAPTDEMRGGRFKFDDYFSTLDHPKECMPETDAVFTDPESLPAAAGRYRHSKEALRRAFVAASGLVAQAASRLCPGP